MTSRSPVQFVSFEVIVDMHSWWCCWAIRGWQAPVTLYFRGMLSSKWSFKTLAFDFLLPTKEHLSITASLQALQVQKCFKLEMLRKWNLREVNLKCSSFSKEWSGVQWCVASVMTSTNTLMQYHVRGWGQMFSRVNSVSPNLPQGLTQENPQPSFLHHIWHAGVK